jgi:hypothetical protein
MRVLIIYITDFLGDKGDKSCIDSLLELPSDMKLLENIHDILLTSPTNMEKGHGETIKAWGFITI